MIFCTVPVDPEVANLFHFPISTTILSGDLGLPAPLGDAKGVEAVPGPGMVWNRTVSALFEEVGMESCGWLGEILLGRK